MNGTSLVLPGSGACLTSNCDECWQLFSSGKITSVTITFSGVTLTPGWAGPINAAFVIPYDPVNGWFKLFPNFYTTTPPGADPDTGIQLGCEGGSGALTWWFCSVDWFGSDPNPVSIYKPRVNTGTITSPAGNGYGGTASLSW